MGNLIIPAIGAAGIGYAVYEAVTYITHVLHTVGSAGLF